MTTELSAAGLLTARLEERILAPLRRNATAARTWFTVTLAFILSLHAAVLLALWLHDASAPPPHTEETAVEVVVEPPKPPPPPPAPAPPRAPAKPEIEKPASSAPRAPSEAKVDTEQAQKETHAPKAAAPASDGQPSPAPPPPAEQTAETKAKEQAAKPDVLQKDAEALDKAKPAPKPKPQKQAKAAKPRPRHVPDALKQLAGASELPDYTFARPTKKSPVSGGTEDSRYLAIVYGMIMMHRDAAPVGGVGNVTVGFNVDDEGHVIGIGIQRSSGNPEIDAAGAAAIRRASPFPPPPPGAPHGLVATINFRAAPASASAMDDQDP